MVLNVYGDVKGKTYLKLISYLVQRCDAVTFLLPNYNKIHVTEKNINMFDDERIGHKYYDDPKDDSFQAYLSKIDDFLMLAKNHLIKSYEDIEYCGDIYEHDSVIYVLRSNEELLPFLTKINNLYDWMYPDAPMDICFYSKGKVYMRTVAHEHICDIYTSSREEINYIKKLGINFTFEHNDESKRPTLYYTLEN